ncbi:MAG TPA: SpoIIE family protein phosphatase [Symbiobacteriaceae bacterium]|nr:SpoIIE family protein phosphatase [Symbiobacteriaceae bacterium]
MRRQLRSLIIGFILLGLVWIEVDNYLRLRQTPWSLLRTHPISFFVLWGGSFLVGLVLDWLTGFGLRRFFRALATLERGEALSLAERQAAAITGMRFPMTAASWLMAMALLFTLAFHQADEAEGLLAILADPVYGIELLNFMLREMLLALTLAILFFSGSRLILRRGLVRLNVAELPGSSGPSVPERFVVLVVAQAVLFVSLVLTTPPGVSQVRMLGDYVLLGLLGAISAYWLASEIKAAIDSASGRIRQLSVETRPNLFQPMAVTVEGEVGGLISAMNALQKRAERELALMEKDLQDARALQRGLLPQSPALPAGWDLAARLIPAHHVGGDFYDIIPLGEGRLGVAVGDVAGKGLPSALLMSYTVSLLRAYAPQYESPAAVLGAVNQMLAAALPQRLFVTAAYCVIDLERRVATLASAGHFPPVVGRQSVQLPPGLPLGVDAEAAYAEECFALAPLDPFLLYSDGLIEATNAEGAVLGAGPVEEAVARARPGGPAEAMVADLLTLAAAHQQHQPFVDDVTVVVLIPPAEVRREFPSRDGVEVEAAAFAAEFAGPVLGAERARAVATAVGEICRNAIIHGNRAQAAVPFVLKMSAGAGAVEARIYDRGELFALPAAPPDLAVQMAGEGPIRGWGIPLAQAMADGLRVEPTPGGKQVVLTFHVAGGGPDV